MSVPAHGTTGSSVGIAGAPPITLHTPPPAPQPTGWGAAARAAQQQAPASYPPAAREYREVDEETYGRRIQGSVQPAAGRQDYEVPEPPRRAADGEHLHDIEAEVAVEAGYADDSIVAPLRTYDRDGHIIAADIVHVLHPDEWPSEANSAAQIGDYELWAAGCLDGDDYETVWRKLRPKVRDIGRFFDEYREITGQASGKSPRSVHSYRASGPR